ncbi:MAG: hypothetical protein ABR562_02400 [Thermoplasmatota archaeon]
MAAEFELANVPAVWRLSEAAPKATPLSGAGASVFGRAVMIEAHVANQGWRDSAILHFRIDFREKARPHIPPASFVVSDIYDLDHHGLESTDWTVKVGQRRTFALLARIDPPTGFYDGGWNCDLVAVPVSGKESSPVSLGDRWPRPGEQGVVGRSPFL